MAGMPEMAEHHTPVYGRFAPSSVRPPGRFAPKDVSLRGLIEKLKSFGINGKLLQWLDNFLTSRSMKVGPRGNFSQLLQVLSGVPQGSVLGPLLFLLYVNELPSWIKCVMKMFADDTKLRRRISSIADSRVLQEDLDSLQLWSDTWQLKFNADKHMGKGPELGVGASRKRPRSDHFITILALNDEEITSSRLPCLTNAISLQTNMQCQFIDFVICFLYHVHSITVVILLG